MGNCKVPHYLRELSVRPSQCTRGQSQIDSPRVALWLQAEYIEFARGPYKNMPVSHRRNAELYSDSRSLCAAVVEFHRKIRRIERVQHRRVAAPACFP